MAVPLRQFLAVPAESRDVHWVKRALQNAIELEWSTIPAYLTAMWSIIDQTTDDVADSLHSIVIQEMLHMGIACNLLSTLGGMPVLAHPNIVPRYPGPLPGEVHVGLVVPLRRISKRVIRLKFMVIEQPESGIHWFCGRAYTTIGTFYDALYKAVDALPDSSILGMRQRVVTHYMNLPQIGSKDKGLALSLIKKIKEQGEGTAGSPMSDGGLAHYFRFGEMWHERRYVPAGGGWDYVGDSLPLPKVRDGKVYPMAPIPKGGYPGVSDKFDKVYSQVIRDMEASWATSDATEGQRLLNGAIRAMKDDLPGLATELMKKRISARRGFTYGPSFLFIP